MEISALTNIAIGPAKVPILLNAPDSLPTEPDALPAAEAIPLIASPVAEAAEAALPTSPIVENNLPILTNLAPTFPAIAKKPVRTPLNKVNCVTATPTSVDNNSNPVLAKSNIPLTKSLSITEVDSSWKVFLRLPTFASKLSI